MLHFADISKAHDDQKTSKERKNRDHHAEPSLWLADMNYKLIDAIETVWLNDHNCDLETTLAIESRSSSVQRFGVAPA